MPNTNERVGEYVLDASIARGTFGEVWRAYHHAWIKQIVAVKIPTEPQYLRNLQREGFAIHGLVHPNIVQAIGFDAYAPIPYLIMEYVPGTSLRPYISKRSLRPTDVVEVLRQVLSALAHSHSKGLVHLDVKPENILIHERAVREGFAASGVVKVTDFGLGRPARGIASQNGIVFSGSLKDAGKIAGTVEYMSPEQRSGGQIDCRSDLYACGVMLYEMLTGERPTGRDLPGDLISHIPQFLNDAFDRSYTRLERRFASAEEFRNALTPIDSAAPGSVQSKRRNPGQPARNVNWVEPAVIQTKEPQHAEANPIPLESSQSFRKRKADPGSDAISKSIRRHLRRQGTKTDLEVDAVQTISENPEKAIKIDSITKGHIATIVGSVCGAMLGGAVGIILGAVVGFGAAFAVFIPWSIVAGIQGRSESQFNPLGNKIFFTLVILGLILGAGVGAARAERVVRNWVKKRM